MALAHATQTKHKLEVRALSKTYPSRTTESGYLQVLQDINLTVPAGQFVSIVGASGCGKTTLIKVIDGLVEADAGQVLVDGQPVHGPGRDRGFVFQQDSLMPWRTVLDNVTFGLRLQGRPPAEQREIATHLIRLVGLQGFERHYPHELSGGMRQRVNLARALAIDPDILLMDEPFAALDAQTREIMQDELLRIWAEQQKTVLFITHQIDEAIYLADRVLVLTSRPGRIKEDIAIPFPRPRALDIKWTPEFNELARHVWSLIEKEVRRAHRG